jgi:hypothetical protein
MQKEKLWVERFEP